MIIFKTSRCKIILTICTIKLDTTPMPPSTNIGAEQENKKEKKMGKCRISLNHNNKLTLMQRMWMKSSVNQLWKYQSNKISSNNNRWPISRAKISILKNCLQRWWEKPGYNKISNQIMAKKAVLTWCKKIIMLRGWAMVMRLVVKVCQLILALLELKHKSIESQFL